MTAGATDRVTFEGVQTTARTVAMVKEQRFLFRLRGGGVYPRITQGGWRPTTDYSKDTHGRDAMDDGTKLWSRERQLLWEWCAWEVGFAGWRRSYIKGLWPVHFHKLPKDGWLSAGAKDQVKQWYQGDNALKSDLGYPRILSSGFVARTWESYLSGRSHGHIALAAVQAAFQTGKPILNSNDIQQIQKALNHFLDSKLLVDGVPGPSTRGVYRTYQDRLYGAVVVGDGDGIPAAPSLEQLGFEVTP